MVKFMRCSRYILTALAYLAMVTGSSVSAADELSQIAVAGMADALSKLESLEVRFCEINIYNETDIPDWSYFDSLSYDDVVANMGIPRNLEPPLGKCNITRCLYRQKASAQFVDLYQATRDCVLAANFAENKAQLFERSINGVNTQTGGTQTLESYFKARLVYKDPGILYSHFYAIDGIYHYVDLFDLENATAELSDGEITITFETDRPNFNSVERDIMILSSDYFLPRMIKIENLSYDGETIIVTRYEVDKYLEMNGARYPERGKRISSKNGTFLSADYFIVDATSAQINIPLTEEAMSVSFEPGALLYDEILNAPFTAQ